MTDDARARALEENRRRSEVMADAQRHGPPGRPCSPTVHLEWAEWHDDAGRTIALICAGCGATVPVPEAEPGVQVVPVDEDNPDPQS